MPDEADLFQTKGPSWSDRAGLGELRAVLSPTGDERSNGFLHGTAVFAARRAMRIKPQPKTILDFGCGNGRFIRFFSRWGATVTGTEITAAMIDAAKRIGIPQNARLKVTDGIHIPEPDHSFDLVWCSSVLRYSLFVEHPVYDQIAAEMFRVLRPGGSAVVLEMYVDSPPEVFMKDFEMVGFLRHEARVIHRYGGKLEGLLNRKVVPNRLITHAGQLAASLRFHFDDPFRPSLRLRDYLFVWRKPNAPTGVNK